MVNLIQNRQFIGWFQAFLAILVFLGINQVMGRFSAVVLDVKPVLYSCSAFASCAMILLAIGGKGPLAKETMRHIDTWVYGTILMMSYIIGLLLFAYVTSTEGTMLQKVSVLLGLLGSWFFIGRKPDAYQLIGTAVVTLGVIVVCMGLEDENKGAVFLLAFFYGALQVSRIFAAELHRPHAKAAEQTRDPRAKARVVGFVMFVISVLFLTLTFFVALAQEAQHGEIIDGLPVLNDFFHAPTIFAGMVAGVFIVAPSRVLEFSSSHIIKAENFTAVTTLSFASTLFWEWFTSPLTGLSIKQISSEDIMAGGLITAGGLLIALTRKRKKSEPEWKPFLQYSPQDMNQVDDTREILANTLEHFEGSVKKSAHALEVPVQVIEALLIDKDKVLAFKDDILKEVARKYRRNVALSDSLTGLTNRAGFMTALKAAAYEADVFSVIFIDLDKFKPINDTYGHNAGDYVLKGVAERLGKMFPKKALATRLGGDEFCVLLLNKTKNQAEELMPEIQNTVAQPFEFEGHTFAVSASMGIAAFPEDSKNAEELLKLADSNMYSEKKER